MTSQKAHLQQQLKCAIVADEALAPGLRRQVGEPHAGHPILVVGRVQILELLALLPGHKSWRGVARNYSPLPLP